MVVLSPHFSTALLARDLTDATAAAPGTGMAADLDREFEYALTYDRDVVTRAAQSLLARSLRCVRARRPSTHPLRARLDAALTCWR